MENRTIHEFYGDDHARLDQLLRESRAQASADIGKALLSFQDFRSGLERHIDWEEKLLFPLFEEKTGMHGMGPTAVMRREHNEIRKLLADIAARFQKSGEERDAAEAALEELLKAHNWKEETILYPAIDQRFTAEERNRIYEKMGV